MDVSGIGSFDVNKFKSFTQQISEDGNKASTFSGFDGVSLSGSLTTFSKSATTSLKNVNTQISKFGDSTNVEIGKSLNGKKDTSKLVSAGQNAITDGGNLKDAISQVKGDADLNGLLGLDISSLEQDATSVNADLKADASEEVENIDESGTEQIEEDNEIKENADEEVKNETSARDKALADAQKKVDDAQAEADKYKGENGLTAKAKQATADALKNYTNLDQLAGEAETTYEIANKQNPKPDNINELKGKAKDARNKADAAKRDWQIAQKNEADTIKAEEKADKALADAKQEYELTDAKTQESVESAEKFADDAGKSLTATKQAAKNAVTQAKAQQKQVISEADNATSIATSAFKKAHTDQYAAQLIMNQANGYEGLATETETRGNRAMTIADAINNAPATSAPTKKGESKMKAFGQFITEHGNDIKSGIDEAVKALGGLFGAIDDDKKASNDSSGSDKSTTTNTTVVQEKVGGTQAKIGGNKTTAASDTAATAATTATTGTSATAQSANTSETEETADEVNLSDSKAEYLKNQAQLTKEINTKGFGDAKAAQDSLMDFVNDSITALSNNPSASNIADAEYALTQANKALKPGANNAKWQGEMKGPVAELKAALDSAKSGSSSAASSTSHTASASSTNKTETTVDTSTSGVESKYGKYQNVYEGVLSSLKGQAKNDNQAKAAEQTFEKLVDNAVDSYKKTHDGQEPEAGTMNDILGKAAMSAGLSSGYSNVNIRIVG